MFAAGRGEAEVGGGFGVEQRPHLGGYWIGGDEGTFAPEVWQALIDDHRVRSVIDVGCGEGHSTRWFADRGLRVLGIEGGEAAVRNSRAPGSVVLHDYNQGPYTPDESFDLAWACEFVEHVAEAFVPHFLATFSCANFVAMTHALPGQPGYNHVNCRESTYWVERLSREGFRYDDAHSQYLRSLTIARYVRGTLLFFARAQGVAEASTLQRLEPL